MSDVNTRLGDAIQLAGLGRREFGDKMAALDHEDGGRTYAQINEYLQGRVEPPLEVVRAAARVLGVRPAWLAFGEGEATPEGEAEVHARRRIALPLTTAVQEAIEAEFPSAARLHQVHQRAIRTVSTVLYRTRASAGVSGADESQEDEYDPDVPPEIVEAARCVGEALQAPFDAMGIDPDDIERLQLYRYVQTACDALLNLLDQGQLELLVANPR